MTGYQTRNLSSRLGLSRLWPVLPSSGSVGFDVLLLVLANVLWGSTDVVAKYALCEMSPPAVLWIRVTVGVLAFLPVLFIRRSEIPRSIRGLIPFLGLGISGFFLNFVLQYNGLKLAPASHATALRVSEALVILVLAALILRERVGRRAAFGLVSGIFGVILVMDIDLYNLSLFTTGSRLGDLLILSGIFVEGFYTIIGKRVLSRTSPLAATALAICSGWILLTIFYGRTVFNELYHNIPSAGAMLACVYLGLFASVLAYWLFYRVLARRASHRVGISIMIQPVIGIPLAALVFGDPMTSGFISGTLLIAAGVYLAFGKSSAQPIMQANDISGNNIDIRPPCTTVPGDESISS